MPDTVPIASIVVGDRQRKALNNIETLADSINRLGLIHPIVITRERQLIAGERRLTACKQLGYTEIAVRFYDDLDPITQHLIELEENIKREDLTWQEQHSAMMEYYRLRRAAEPTISMEKVGEAIGLDRRTIGAHAIVERYRDHPVVQNAESYSTARNAAMRLHERAKDDEAITHGLQRGVYTPEILHADFLEWASAYSGPKFNLIHCDFPYGINQQTSDQAAVRHLGAYDDSPDVYWNLLRGLATELDRFCAPSAHMIFWLSANVEIIARTWELLKLLDGFRWDEVPLIWVKSDGKGIVPDANRRPRRVYELAYFGWRGDRRLIRTFNNVASAPTERLRHPHEKAELALGHFFSGLVDSNTRLLDPTCGSGSALRAAKALGAQAVFGIEKDKEFADVARRALRSDQPDALSESPVGS